MSLSIQHLKTVLALPVLAAIAIGSSSCAAGPNTKRGAVGGAALGGIAGGIIGNQSGRALEGAAIGAGAGALGGAALGSARDDEQYRRY